MMVLTPGNDLAKITEGVDWTFLLDISGSMGAKLPALARGMEKTLSKLDPKDRFRIDAFNDAAAELVSYQPATPANAKQAAEKVDGLRAGGSTNLFAGIELGIKGVDKDRTTGIVLVTDGVTNTGPQAQKDFEDLLKKADVRIFTIVMGNNANWPLMEFVSQTTQGFYVAVSNDDDAIGRVVLAKNKVTHEAMHNVSVQVEGVKITDLTPNRIGSLYHGQQLVLFGHYREPGHGRVILHTEISGKPKTFDSAIELPEVDADNPEIERLWALERCEELSQQIRYTGNEKGISPQIVDVATHYSIVTDYTSMVVLREEQFELQGITRNNATRVAQEQAAQQQRATQPARNFTPPQQIASASQASDPQRRGGFGAHAPSLGGGGGGAIDPMTGVLSAFWLGLGALAWRRSARMKKEK